MKTNIKASAIISIVALTAWTVYNMVSIYLSNKIPFAKVISGGEITTYKGIGFSMDKIYSLAPKGQDNVITHVHYDLVTLGLLTLGIFAVFLIFNILMDPKKIK